VHKPRVKGECAIQDRADIKHSLSGWSLHCSVQAPVKIVRTLPGLEKRVRLGTGIPRGAGRSFGDASLPDRNASIQLDPGEESSRVRWSSERGVVVCSAAASLDEVLRITVPQGWVIPTLPGASQITIGGAIAADAHGKNHFSRGSIADHLIQFSLLLVSGEIITVDRKTNEEIFWASVGGLGLTGLILEASIALQPTSSIRIAQSQHRFASVVEMVDIIEAKKESGEFLLGTVRGDFQPGQRWEGSVVTARHVEDAYGTPISEYPRRKHPNVPSFISTFPISKFSTWTLNQAIRARIKYFSDKDVDMDRFFFPQDSLGSWNQLFGKRGFIDYQCCIPIENVTEFFNKLHEMLKQHSIRCFLVAIKRFRSSSNPNPLTFALDGISVALDFPIRSDTDVRLSELDELVVQFGGRVNLVKDARLPQVSFVQMYPRASEWLEVKHQVDPNRMLRSKLSSRLGLT
jgi:decaprenylphospho-beta-D-ribofuranose 2-oxidase